jgi:hypothetical protein
MSEYQYFEFTAIDRPLTDGEMTALRNVSSRATITPSGFVNHYEWATHRRAPTNGVRAFARSRGSSVQTVATAA